MDEPRAADNLLLNHVTEEIKPITMETETDKYKGKRKIPYKQWAACVSATLSMVAVGTVYGWTTTVNPRLTNANLTDQVVPLTKDEGSWVVAVTSIGSMLGPFYAAYFASFYGRKLCLLQTSIFYIIGWLLTLFAQNVWYLYAARIILGFGVGMSYTTNPMYVSEIADVKIRGALGTLIAVNVYTGSLLACAVGPWVSYHTLTLVLLSVPILFVITFVWFPETPYFYASKNRDDDAIKSISFFKGDKCSEQELRAELAFIKNNIGTDELKVHLSDLLLLKKLRNRKALMIVMILILGQQLSGNYSTMQYLTETFEEAGTNISPDVATIIVFAVTLVFGGLSTVSVEKAGRRYLLIISSFGSAITLAIFGIYMLMKNKGVNLKMISFLPVIDTIAFQIVYQIGLGTMPNLLIGELFPTDVKGISAAIVTIFDGLLGLIVSKLFERISNNMEIYVPYLFFSISCFVLFIFIYGFVPETKSRTFSEIQDILGDLKPFKNLSADKVNSTLVFRKKIKSNPQEKA